MRSLGADEAVDYKKQAFETVLRDYDAALGIVRGDSIEKSIGILKIVFARMSRRIKGLAKKRDVDYSFPFARADGNQLAEIGQLLQTQRIRPVIGRMFPCEQAKDALGYLAQGRARGKVVLQMR